MISHDTQQCSHARRVIKVYQTSNGNSETETLNDKQHKKRLLKAIWLRLLFGLRHLRGYVSYVYFLL